MLKKIWDQSGIIVSIICLIHCLALPVVSIILPALNIAFFNFEQFHQLIFLLVASFGVLAFAVGFRVHKNFKLLLFSVFSIAVIGIATILEHYIDEKIAHALNAFGSLLVIAAHLLNLKLQRQMKCQHEHCRVEHGD
jgi:hypothetical protein